MSRVHRTLTTMSVTHNKYVILRKQTVRLHVTAEEKMISLSL